MVTGVDDIINKHNQLAQSFDDTLKKIQTSVSGVSDLQKSSIERLSGKSGLKDKLGTLTELNKNAIETNKSLGSILSDVKSSGVDNLIARLHHTAALAFKAATEISKLTEAVTNYNAAVGAASNLKLARVVDSTGAPLPGEGKRGSRSERERDIADLFLDKSAFFMFRYRMYSGILDAIVYSLADIGMGRSRAKIADALGELSAVAFTGSQKKQAEFAANVFSMKLWNVTTEEYLQAMSSTASAFDINSIGFENMRRMNEAAMKFGKLSKLSAEKSADLMTGIILQLMTRFPADVNEKLKSGLTAKVGDYGEVDLGGLSERIAAQAAKAIQISTVWGPGIAGAFKYMLPELLEKGWNVPAALALLGSIKDAGFPAEQIGRATKETFLSAPSDFARTILWATDRWETEGEGMTKGEAKSLNDEKVRLLTKTIQGWFSDPKEFQKNMPLLGEALRLAEKKGALPVEDLGLSKYFMSVTRTLTTAGAMERFKEQLNLINKADYDEVSYMTSEMLHDAGTAWARISNSFLRFYQTMADTPLAHSLAEPVSKRLDFLSAYSALPRMLQARGLKYREAVKAFETEYQKPFEMMFGEYLTKELRTGIDKAYGESWDIMIFPEYFALLDDKLNEVVKSMHSQVKKALVWNWGKEDKDAGYLPFMPKASRVLDKLMNPFEVEWKDPGRFLYALVEDMYDNVSSVVSEVWTGIKWVYGLGARLLSGLGSLLEWLTDTVSQPLTSAYNYITGKQESPKIESLSPIVPNSYAPSGDTLSAETEALGKKLNEAGVPGTFQPGSESSLPSVPQDNVTPGQVAAPNSWLPAFLQSYTVPVPTREETPIQIENRLIVDGRELAYIISDIIERNRTTNYQAFGSDPFGYNTAV